MPERFGSIRQLILAKNLLHQVQHRDGMKVPLIFILFHRPFMVCPLAVLARQLRQLTAEALQSR
jgi:hypothetical protein